MANTRRPDTLRMVQLAILIALEAIMAFTPLGFIMIPPISATLMHIPVIIGAILLGPLRGGILGGCFGLFSVIRAIPDCRILSGRLQFRGYRQDGRSQGSGATGN